MARPPGTDAETGEALGPGSKPWAFATALMRPLPNAHQIRFFSSAQATCFRTRNSKQACNRKRGPPGAARNVDGREDIHPAHWAPIDRSRRRYAHNRAHSFGELVVILLIHSPVMRARDANPLDLRTHGLAFRASCRQPANIEHSVVKNHIQERFVYVYSAVIFNKSHLAEPVHEEADA